MTTDEARSNVIDLDSRRPQLGRRDTFLRRAAQMIAEHATSAEGDLERRVSALEAFMKKIQAVRDTVCGSLEIKKTKWHC